MSLNFKDDGIPEEIETTIYVCVCTASEYYFMIGKVQISDCDYEERYSGDAGDDSTTRYKLLASMDATIALDIKSVDFVCEQVKCLEKQKECELAEHHMKMKEFQDRLDNLLVIEYQPEEAA